MGNRNRTDTDEPTLYRSVCPVARTLDLVGDRWSLLIVRDLLAGKSHFKEFLASPERIATNVLTDRLTRLTAHGFIERYATGDIAGREAYRLSAKGQSLRELLGHIKNWGLKNIAGSEGQVKIES